MELGVDVAVVGAGFGGSLAALVLHRAGLEVALIERGSHPRFAIGESSTPIADLILKSLARSRGLPRLEPLAQFGSWQAAYPEVGCGLKRGFSYFRVPGGSQFAAREDHSNELLVAASANDAVGDTHWYRHDVDHFLAKEVEACGIPYWDRTESRVERTASGWLLDGVRERRPVRVRAGFLLDATGNGGFVAGAVGAGSEVQALRTNSRSIFGHFTGLRPWAEIYRGCGGRLEDHPFDCDRSALHLVIDEGWMWQLRFGNGVTSAGFVLDADHAPADGGQSAEAEWRGLMGKYPSIAAQFEGAKRVQPEAGLARTGRLQRLVSRCAGENWAMLPHAAGFIDPFYSTGIAHTLSGVEYLGEVLPGALGTNDLAPRLAEYDVKVRAEIRWIDRLVSDWYVNRGEFESGVASSMLYFTTAIWGEHRRAKGLAGPGAGFLSYDQDALRNVVESGQAWIRERRSARGAKRDSEGLLRGVGELIREYNVAGLCDPEARNMYRYTALPEDAKRS